MKAEKFKTVYWLDDVSNKEILVEGQITQHGTVISELAIITSSDLCQPPYSIF